MTPNTPMTELPVDDLETAVRAFMPLAQVAFLWTHEASPPEDEIQRYRDAYHNVLRALRQSDTRIEGGGEPAEWQVEAAARALARNRYLAGHAVEQVNALVDRDWPSYARDARAALRAAAPPVTKSPTSEHVEGDVLSADHIADAGKMVGATGHLCGLPDFGTYAGQVVLVAPEWLQPAWPTGIGIDVCLALEIQTLWGKGVRTNGHCCGHGKADGYIGVEAGSVDLMQSLGYVEITGRPQHYHPKTQLLAYPHEAAARIAHMHAHHALWRGLIPYGWGEDVGKFGVGLANRIAQAISEDATRHYTGAARTFLSTIGEKPDAE